MAKDALKTCKHTIIHIRQTASVGSARCWRHIRFIVETWRPACSSSVTQTDSSGPSNSQAPLLLAHCCYQICCTSIRGERCQQLAQTFFFFFLKGHTWIFLGKITSSVSWPGVKMWKCWFHGSGIWPAVPQFETLACWVEATATRNRRKKQPLMLWAVRTDHSLTLSL